jgi:Protein of unknown function (DUF1329)
MKGEAMRRPVLLGIALALGFAVTPVLAQSASPWAPPAEGSCAPSGGTHVRPGAPPEDAVSAPFAPGDTLAIERLPLLERYLPDFLWPHRERFFYEGMRLEIGSCFRDYGAPDFFVAATEAGRGKATLAADGGLVGWSAGLPFHPADIASDASDAGLRWLWNVQSRYQAAGFRGKFRMTDLVGRIGRAEPFEGEIFKLLTAHRADRPGYEAPGAKGRLFVAGGLFSKPFDAREYAWRQFRPDAMLTEAKRSDDLHAYLPQWRRVRRISSAGTEGIYMPSFAVSMAPTQVLPTGGGVDGAIGAIQVPTDAGGTIQTKRSGYEGLEFRPLLYDVKVVGLHDVLAPINAARPSYPENAEREFGPWGLSFASDRWDLRRALVLDLRRKANVGSEIEARQLLYVDLQTLQPLYVATFDDKNEMTNVGMYVGRWSEDRSGYPRWPDDPARAIRVIDPVGASFANLAEQGSWRRESWANVSTPPSDDAVKRLLSVNQLTKRR